MAAADDPLHSRLRRLRREGESRSHAEEQGAEQADASTDGHDERGGSRELGESKEIPAWLRGRLTARGARGGGPARVDPAARLGGPSDLGTENGARGAFAARTRVLPVRHGHGDWRLDEVLEARPSELALLAKDAALEALEPRRAVYLDIETTGLSGGAGTVPFLVALGWFEGASFRLWQGFLRGPEEEPALLDAVAARVRASTGVVSFFGKSFDRHRLEDKMRIHGVDPPFADRPHLDLYHPLRRLYRPALHDGRLQTMERALCGVARTDDLPGSRAPEAWFDFLAGRAHRLEDVFRHNADDVLSLVVLAAHLGRTRDETRRDGSPLPGAPAARARGLAHVLDALRRRDEALVWAERALARGEPADDPRFAALLERLRRTARRRSGKRS